MSERVLLATTKFEPLSEYNAVGMPLLAVNHRSAAIWPSVVRSETNSMCGAFVVKHTNTQG